MTNARSADSGFAALIPTIAIGDDKTGNKDDVERENNAASASRGDAGSALPDGFSLTEVLSRLTVRDAQEVEMRTRRHRDFLTKGVVPQVAAGLVAAAEARPANVLEFLGDYLIRSDLRPSSVLPLFIVCRSVGVCLGWYCLSREPPVPFHSSPHANMS